MVFLMANIVVVANWLAESGIEETANWIHKEYLAATAIAVIVALLVLLASPSSGGRGGRSPAKMTGLRHATDRQS